MHFVNLRCLFWGHDDRIRRGSGRMYLECAECGRKTRGWNLTRERTDIRRRGAATRSWARTWGVLWSQVHRDPFAAVSLR